jgi:outer membrane protein
MSSALSVIITLILIFAVFSHQLQASRMLTLNEAVNLAVKDDPETKNAKRSIHIGQTKRSQARLRYLPKLEFGLTNSPQVNYYGQPIINNMLWNSYIGMEQPLYAGDTIKNSVRQADSEIHRQELEFTILQQRIAIEATKAYFQTLSSQGMVEQYQALLQQGDEDLREVQTRKVAGTSSKMEALEIETRLLDIQQKLSKSKAEHQADLTGLKKILGLEGDEDIRLIDELPIPDIKGNFETLLGEAQVKRPELQYFAENLRYNQLKNDIEKGKQKPQLSLVAYRETQSPQVYQSNKNFAVMLKASFSWGNSTLSFQESRNQIYPNSYAYPQYSGAPPLATYYFPVRTIKYSLFDNSSNRVYLEKAQSDRDLAQDRWTKEKQNLAGDLKSTIAQKRESLTRIDIAKKQIAMAEELVDINRTKYRTGLVTLSDVLKARFTLTEARINLLNAKKDFAVSTAELHRILGRNIVGAGS